MNGSYLAFPGEEGTSAESDLYHHATRNNNQAQHSFLGESSQLQVQQPTLYAAAAYNPQYTTFTQDHHSLYMPAHLPDTLNHPPSLHNTTTTYSSLPHNNALKDYPAYHLAQFAAADSYHNNTLQPPNNLLSYHETDAPDPLLFMTSLLSSSTTAIDKSSSEEFVMPPWLNELTIPCSALSLTPLTGKEVVQRVQWCMNDVLTRYIPCVDFLVECQQSLRKGLAVATRRIRRQEALTPVQFCTTFVEPLPGQFYAKSSTTMEQGALQEAVRELQTLVNDARNCIRQGSEAVKNTFLGGMKDGESWGLRKWLSRHGNALRICTDLECLLAACKQLDRACTKTQQLARLLRPMAQRTLEQLKREIPASYQEVSAAHPYLPFFHRLEAALRNMSQFDPEEEAVICIDDDSDDDDEIEVYNAPPPPRKRKQQEVVMDVSSPKLPPMKEAKMDPQTIAVQNNDESSSGESEDDSVVEIVDVKPSTMQRHVPVSRSPSDSTHNWPVPIDEPYAKSTAEALANSIEQLAVALEEEELVVPRVLEREPFWNPSRFASALRLFALILRQPEAIHFVDNVNEDALVDSGHRLFSHVVKHPLCFRDIQAALIQNDSQSESSVPRTNNGKLLSPSQWNMWKGSELLQAIDLIFLNSLAYGQALGEGKSQHRSKVNKLRKTLWNGIHAILQAECDAAARRLHTPTRRSEDSGFVVYKIQER
ncbi:hypothetical protein FisN_18Hh033 [Fistulifera solaris]|uniref:Uncharacterized protein n=1 Tax=Fistulifera solaris TaxID=1519565 RepID=A0A1Z5JUW2_FISSO|nr:hypothetical protein FisN_18Hh033 [Fistulifera solaris]|eukprot:GAX17833.1 hypothetical protein FisN_18Hh033 [Fistulifera solaris]